MPINYRKLYEEAQEKIDGLEFEIERTRKVVDLAGIARHMRVDRYTPQQWKQRGHLPPVDFPDIREPLWYASTIRDQFCVPTRRVWYDNPDAEMSAVA